MRSSKEIIDIIKNKREELGLSQRELAKQIGGISHSTISRYEKYERNFPINDAPLFAKALNIDLNYLLDINNQENQTPKPTSETTEYKEIIEPYKKLNLEGQKKVVTYATDLVNTDLYNKE